MSRDPLPVDDQALLGALAADLDAGFADLVRAYERVLFSVALRLCKARADAEDLAAESFLRAYRALRGYERARILDLQPAPWLVTILLNTWRNDTRSASRRPRLTPLATLPETASAETSVEMQLEQNETRHELGQLVALLPPNQRVAVVLRHVVGLPLAELADVMGIPEGTAKSHVSRGLRKLREAYHSASLAHDLSAARPIHSVTLIRQGHRPLSAVGKEELR